MNEIVLEYTLAHDNRIRLFIAKKLRDYGFSDVLVCLHMSSNLSDKAGRPLSYCYCYIEYCFLKHDLVTFPHNCGSLHAQDGAAVCNCTPFGSLHSNSENRNCQKLFVGKTRCTCAEYWSRNVEPHQWVSWGGILVCAHTSIDFLLIA